MFEGIKTFLFGPRVHLDFSEFSNRVHSDENAVILDVRTAEEYRSGHLDGAVNLDALNGNLMTGMDRLDINKSYYVYCRTGGRSENACLTLLSAGFKKVYNLRGGLEKSRKRHKLVS